MDADVTAYGLDDAFAMAESAACRTVVATVHFRRKRFTQLPDIELLLDTFPDSYGVSCCFVRLARDRERRVRLPRPRLGCISLPDSWKAMGVPE